MENLTYTDGPVQLEGYIAYDKHTNEKKPAVLVFHDWSGKNKFACDKATKLAELGYVGFAVDMYGNGKIGTTKEEKSALIQPFMRDRHLLQTRALAALAALRNLTMVDQTRLGAIGFCFGGLCALDLARSGADLKGVVSFHGLLQAPESIEKNKIIASILALHGFDDPMATPAQAMAFAEEMTKAQADWQLDIYGNTMHAFANPEANDPAFGTLYNKKSDQRSWIAMLEFFRELF